MAENYFDQLLELAAGIVALADTESTLDKREWKAAKEQHDSLETVMDMRIDRIQTVGHDDLPQAVPVRCV